MGALKSPRRRKYACRECTSRVGHRAGGGVEGLAKYLAPEHLGTAYIAAFAAKQVDLENLEVQQADKISDSPIHVQIDPLAALLPISRTSARPS